MNKIKLTIAIFALILVGCSDDDNPAASSTPTLTEGTYNVTDVTFYETADCSGTGITHMCTTADASTEATCPSGGWMTFVDWMAASGQDESVTIAGGVMTYSEGIPGTYTIDGTTISITDPAGCWDYEDEEAVEAADEAACDAANGSWEDASCSKMVFTLSTGQ